MFNLKIGKKRKYSDFWDSAFLNDRTYMNIFEQIKDLALNAILYKNLPDSIDPRWIEMMMFHNGYAVYFNDEVLGDLCLECALGGQYDVYNIPMERNAFAANGYQRRLYKNDSVIIYNNYSHTPGIIQAQLYAYRLANILRTMDVNVSIQKMPFILKTSAETQLTTKNLVKQIAGNEMYVYVDKDFDLKNLEVVPTTAKYIGTELRALYRDIWNECLTFYGYENSNQNKKERSVEAEVTSEYGWIEGQRNVMLKSRRECFEKVNKMFGTNIEVEFSSQLPSMLNKSQIAGGSDPYGGGEYE